MLCRDIIQPRVEEIFSFVKAEIARLGCEDMLASGAVITGGATQLPGMTELGRGDPGHPRAPRPAEGRGRPGRGGAAPTFSTGVGLVQYGVARHSVGPPVGEAPPKRQGLFSRLRRTISSAF